MIGDTMETDIRGAIEAGMHAYLVLTGSTQLQNIGDYVYQPTRILESVADIVDEIRTGKPSDRLDSPVFSNGNGSHAARHGNRFRSDDLSWDKPRPRPAMTK
jgi:NagD protein